MNRNLFQLGNFPLHSGDISHWKIECDVLTSDDWAALAAIAFELLPPFGSVVGVERGGISFAKALSRYLYAGLSAPVLIADDVLTTGASMEECRQGVALSQKNIIGVVAFARGKCPDWITPVWTLGRL